MLFRKLENCIWIELFDLPICKQIVSSLEQKRSFIEKYFAQLRECVGEAIRIFPNFNLTDVKLAQLYVNTTACVLAKTRCSQMNPITGEFQEDDLANKLNIPTVNAVLVNTNYDINIVQLPFHSSSIDVCAKYRNYEQASWPTVMCWLKFSRLRNGLETVANHDQFTIIHTPALTSIYNIVLF